MLVLGIDPGSIKTGIGWIRKDSNGKITKHQETLYVNTDFPLRYIALREKLLAFFEKMPEKPHAIAIEEPDLSIWDGSGLPWPLFFLHGAYAIIYTLVCTTFHDSILHHLRPGSWKSGMPKDVNLKTLREKYGWTDMRTPDEADALGLADFAFTIAEKTYVDKIHAVSTGSLFLHPQPLNTEPLCPFCGDRYKEYERRIMDFESHRIGFKREICCRKCKPLQSVLDPMPESYLSHFEKILRHLKGSAPT